jgi:hypothetical protein
MIIDVPDYSNPMTRATEEKMGPFKYDQDDQFDENDLIDRGPYELDNGAIYKGQWSREGLRYGRGVQIWTDGSKYEGYWRSDMANGRGRLIHAGNLSSHFLIFSSFSHHIMQTLFKLQTFTI